MHTTGLTTALLARLDRTVDLINQFRALRIDPALLRVRERLVPRYMRARDVLAQSAAAVIGNVRYERPAWVERPRERALALKLALRGRLQAYGAEHPRAFPRAAAALLLCAALLPSGVVCAFLFPSRSGVGVRITAPGAPDLRPGAPAAPLVVTFGQSVAPIELVGRQVTNYVRLEPKLEGRWTWTDDRALEFRPAGKWPVGTEFTVSIDQGLLAPNTKLNRYSASFRTEPLIGRIVSYEYHVDYKNPKDKRLRATLSFNYPVDLEDLKGRVRLEQLVGSTLFVDGKKIPFTIHANETLTEVYVASEILPLQNEDRRTRLIVESGFRSTWKGRAATEVLSREALVAGIGNLFRVLSSQVQIIRNQEAGLERVLILETKGEATAATMLSGMEAFLLPRDRPAVGGMRAEKNHAWRADEVGPEVLALSEKITLTAVPGDREFSTTHSFRFVAEAGRRVYVKVGRGIKNYAGYMLNSDHFGVHMIYPLPKMLAVLHEGAVMSLAGDKKLSFTANNVEHAHIEVQRVLPEDINHLVSQTGGNFQSPYFHNYSFTADNISERFEEVRPLTTAEPGRMQYFSFDMGRYLSRREGRTGLFLIKASAYDIKRKRAQNHISDRRFILVTDMAFLVKEGVAGEQEVYVQSVARGTPVAGVDVAVLGRNGIPIAAAQTAATGIARLPSLRSFRREKEPTAFLLRKGPDVSFMPYRRQDRQLNMSRFNVGGLRGADRPGTLSVQVFSDRGLYRPGDRMHAGIIVKSAAWQSLPEGLPLQLSLIDPRGVEIERRRTKLPATGFLDFSYRFSEQAPTGSCRLNVHTVKDGKRAALLGSTALRVEEFKPDRMKVDVTLTPAAGAGWISPDALRARASLRYLFGKPAADHRIRGKLLLSPARIHFARYAQYSFFDAARAEQPHSEDLAMIKTDVNGEALLPINLSRHAGSSYALTVYAEGFEADSGRSVRAAASAIISPLKYMIGYRSDGNLQYISRNSRRALEFIAVSPNLDKASADGLKLQLLEERWTSALVRQSDGAFRYTSVKREIKRSESDFSVPAGGRLHVLDTTRPGTFVLIVNNAQGTQLQRVRYRVAGAANVKQNLERNAELTMTLNKADFVPGEEIQVSIVAPYTGSGIITIERDKVYASRWFKTDTNSAVATIRVPENLEGNAYVNVAFVRSTQSEEIYTSPLSYGVEPFTISRERRHNVVTLGSPTRARPGRPLEITYRTSRPGKIIVYAVDEGILQVASYKTPRPLSYFFRKRALETHTTQILDLILPEYSVARRVSAFGGGTDTPPDTRLNPFRRGRVEPVVYWSGILPSDRGERKITYDVPEGFNGSLRVMAVAVSDDAVGSAERRTNVQDDFILSPNVPAFAAPGDELEVSVGVVNNAEGTGAQAPVSVQLDAGARLQVLGKSAQSLVIPEGRERSVVFKVKVLDDPGGAELKFTASGGGRASKNTQTMSVRPPVPYRTTVRSGVLTKGDVQIPVERSLYPHFRSAKVSVSPLPLALASGLLQYLERFPYGCTEQLVSQTFPLLVLHNRPAYAHVSKNTAGRVAEVVRTLGVRQNREGAFGFWAANTFTSDIQSAYAMHFLTEAKGRGFAVPPALMSRGLLYMRRVAEGRAATRSEWRARAYAVYILALNGVVSARGVAALDEAVEKDKSLQQDLAAVYLAGTYDSLQKKDRAHALIDRLRLVDEQPADLRFFYDPLVRSAQTMYVLGRHFPERLKKITPGDLETLVRPIREQRFHSLSAAYAILALDVLSDALVVPELLRVEATESHPGAAPRSLGKVEGLLSVLDFSGSARTLQLVSRGPTPVFYQVSESGFDTTLPTAVVARNLEVFHEYLDDKNQAVTEARIGDTLTVRLRMRAIGSAANHIAVVDLLPGGFEPVLESVRSGLPGSGFRPEHVDAREDRVILYGSVGQSLTGFSYQIRAVNSGSFALPPAYAASMYDSEVEAVRPGAGRITVRNFDAR